MKKFIALAGLVLLFVTAKAQFPTKDSLRSYININVRNSAVQSFTNLRLNTALNGIVNFLDSAGLGGSAAADTIYTINDSTARYKKGSNFYTFSLKGVYDSRRKVDSVYMLNDTMMNVVINGENRTVLIRGNGSGGGGTEALDATSMVRANSKLFSKNPVFTTLSSLRSVATADLNSGFIYRTNVNGVLGEWYYDGADASTADDTAMTLVTTGGKRLKRLFNGIIYPEWFGAVGDGVADDWWPIQKAVNYLSTNAVQAYKISFTKKVYLLGQSVQLPLNITGTPIITLEGNGAKIKTNTAFAAFSRIPSNQTEAQSSISDYRAVIRGFTFEGNSVVGQKALDLGAIYQWTIEKCIFSYQDTAVALRFSLQSSISECEFKNNYNVSIFFKYGDWSGGSTGGAACNANSISNVRIYNYDDATRQAYAAIYTISSDQTLINNLVSEGAHPRYHIIMDYAGSTNINQNIIENIWFESAPNFAAHSVLFKLVQSGSSTIIKNIQSIYPDTLFDIRGSIGGNKFVFDGIPYYNLSPTPFIATGVSASSKLIFKNVVNGTAFRSVLYSSSSWLGGFPNMDFAVTTDEDANGIDSRFSSSVMYFEPAAYTTDVDSKHFRVNGIIESHLDNTYAWGANSTTNKRPKSLFVGSTGVYVDTLGRFKFGHTTNTPDVTIARLSQGWLGIYDNSTNFKNLQLDSGLFNGRSGYTSAFSLASMGDNDFITKQQATDLVASSAASIDFDPYWFTGTGVDPDFKSLDSTKFVTTYRGDTLHVRDSLLQDQINAFGRKVDTIYRVPGIDAIYYKIAGVEYSIKDSTGTGAGAGDNWGTQKVEHGGTLVRDGTLGSLLDVDTAVGKIASQYMIKTYTTTAGVGISVTVTTDADGNKTYQVTNTGSPGSNPMNALDIRSYGGTMDASVPASGSTPNGTDNTPFLQAAINAAADGQWVIVPPGAGSGVGYKFATPLDTIKGPKRVYILFLADVYLANNDLIRIRNNSGDYEQHRIIFEGNIFGRVNQASHNKTTFDAGTGPVWSTYTNVVVKLIDVNQTYVQFNRVSGCKAPIEILTGLTTGSGAQENTVIGRRFTSCRYGILLTSFDGGSYCDKNYFGGPEGGTLRIGGNIPLMIDGFAATDYSGAFRSNEYHFLIENADSLPVANGDITENWFDITVEGGTSTGVLSSTATWHMKSSGTYYVRTPKYTWKGVYGAHRLGTGSSGSMGVDGTFKGSIWAQGSTAYYGNEGVIDGSGNIVIKAKESISNSTRNGAPSYVKFVNDPTYQPQDVVTITASSYTVASGVRVVKFNNASGTLTLPSPSTYPTRRISIININSGALAISGTLGSGAAAIILGNKSLTYFSDGSAWWAEGDGVGGALTFGTLHKVTDANVTVDDGDYIIEVYNQSATRTVTIPAASSYPNRVIWIVQRDGNGNTLNISQNWRGVDGALSGVLLNNNAVMLVSDGSEWRAVIERL